MSEQARGNAPSSPFGSGRTALFLLFGAAVAPVRAEVAASGEELFRTPRILGYVSATERNGTLLPLAEQQDRALGLPCRTGAYRLHVAQVMITSAIEMSEGQAHPVNGEWIVRYEWTRCGQTQLYNAIFTADPLGATPRARSFLPGRTAVSPRLATDALGIAIPLVLASATTPSCKTLVVADTVLDGGRREADGPGDTPVVHERWSFRACGEKIDADIRFSSTPSDGGTDISVTVLRKD